ncbi:CHAT domain-containing protein [Neolewinella persica]|uniref:CHAT domain-containing protein n=1 Tax=Neolewinella persica TaxID=70998 RepID=UPI00037AE46F|nr:CHAT domain-containing tetratricopeptide repeat protein [Neolewinella persica]
MSINVRWLAVAFLFFWCGLQPLTGQNCPSITEALKTLYAAEDGGETLIRQIKESCPAAADSLSIIFHKRSVYAYSSEVDLERAIFYALKALEAQEEVYANTAAEPLGKTLANLGLFYRLSGQYTTSLPYLRRANMVFSELGLFKRTHWNQQQMVMLWHATGDIGRSEELLRVMLLYARKEKAKGGNDRIATMAEAETLRLLGEQANQAEQYAEGLPDFAAAAILYEELGDIRWLLMSYMGQGRALYHLKRYDEARVVTKKALSLAERYELNFDKGVMCNLLALVENEQFMFEKASAFQQQGESYALEEKNPRLLSVLVNTDAEIALGQKDFATAKKRNAEAIALLTDGWQYNEEATLPMLDEISLSEFKLEIFQFLALRAEIFHQAGDVAGAMEVIRLTDQMADLLRLDFNGQVSNLFWRQEALPLYELGIELSREADDSESVFYLLEKSRSILLLEAMVTADVRENISQELATQLATTEHKLRSLRRRSVGEEGDAQDQTARRIVGLSDTLQQLRTVVAEQYPVARDLLTNPSLVDISGARALLSQGLWDRQVHFFMGDKRATAFSLTATEVKTIDLGPTEVLDTLVRRVLAFYTSAGAIDQAPADYIAASHAAYQSLLAPLKVSPGERLLIIPDGILAYLPFAALVSDLEDASLATAAYLIRRNQVSFAQSTTVLGRQQKGRKMVNGDAFAFSPFIAVLPNNTAPALPFSESEVTGFKDHYSGLWLTDTAASRKGLLSGLPGRSIIHLSTHAYASTDQHEQPRILTATEPVYLSDIYGLRLRADLVTLSACQSNIGPLAQGEGVLGLGRAFTAAGAGGVIASLWSLNDRATSEIITGFYDQLAGGVQKPEALHQAQLAYLNREDLPAYLKSPYYWAGLTYYGNAGKLPAGGIPRWVWGLLFLAAGGLAVWRWFGRK